MTRGTHRTQTEAAYEELARLIVRAEIEPGAPIEEGALMERLGVGRTPLREALQRLIHQALVQHLPNRGYFVTTASATELFRVFELREQLEVLAASLAAERCNAASLEAYRLFLEAARQGIVRHGDDREWNIATDHAFHDLVARASGNSYLQADITRYYNLSARVLYLSGQRMALVRDEIDRYAAMQDALERHDVEAAVAVMRAHMSFDPAQAATTPSQPMSRG
jgi:DNA-binding GntR family transcriptional regulator